MKYAKELAFTGLMGVLVAVAGCQSQQQQPPFEQAFFAQGDVQATTSILDMQAARGARADGMLHAVHFEGAGLSPLGQQKLALMLKDTAPLPLVVYVVVPASDARSAARRDAVQNYLVSAGLQASQFKIEAGANPDALHPSAGAISRLPKTENPAAQATGPAAAADATAAAPASAAGAPPDLSSLGLQPKK